MVLAMGIVYKAPYHSHHQPWADDGGGGDAGGRLPGYHIRVRWWDPVQHHWTFLVPYVPGALDVAHVQRLYPLDASVLFTFVAYTPGHQKKKTTCPQNNYDNPPR
jgi:hypothetical protein